MRKLLLSTLAAIALVSAMALAAEPTTFGAGLTVKEATPIASLLASPADFQGRTVRVEGLITAVCAAMGCWMALAPNPETTGSTLLIQVEHDGAIVFPVTAKGRLAAAQGVMERIDGGEGQEAAEELARSGAAKTEAPTQWRIKATGAVIY